MVSKVKAERRKAPKKTSEELFRMADIDTAIAKERREHERTRLSEVKEQKRLWVRTIAVCLAINLCLVGLAMFGVFS